MTEPERMFSTALRGMSFGAGLTGNGGRRDDDVEVGDALLERSLLLCLLLGRELRCVAARGLLRSYAEIQERRTEALDLLLHGGADVEGRDDGAEPASRRDRLQTGDAGTDDRAPARARSFRRRS